MNDQEPQSRFNIGDRVRHTRLPDGANIGVITHRWIYETLGERIPVVDILFDRTSEVREGWYESLLEPISPHGSIRTLWRNLVNA